MPLPLPPEGGISYNPGVVDRSGEILAGGISQAANSIGKMIEGLTDKVKQTKAMRTMAVDGLGMDPDEVDHMDLPTLTGKLQGAALRTSRAHQQIMAENEQLKNQLSRIQLANESAMPAAMMQAFPQDTSAVTSPASMMTDPSLGAAPGAPTLSPDQVQAMMQSSGPGLRPDAPPAPVDIRQMMMQNYGAPGDGPRSLMGYRALDPMETLNQSLQPADDAGPAAPAPESGLAPGETIDGPAGNVPPAVAQMMAGPAPARSSISPQQIAQIMSGPAAAPGLTAQQRIAAAIRTPGLSAQGIQEIMAAVRSGIPPQVVEQPGLNGDRVYAYGNRLVVKNDKQDQADSQVQFTEDPATGTRFAQLGKVLSPSGINPDAVKKIGSVELQDDEGKPTGMMGTWDGKKWVLTKKAPDATGALKPVTVDGKAIKHVFMDASGKVHDLRPRDALGNLQEALGANAPAAAPAAGKAPVGSYADFLKKQKK